MNSITHTINGLASSLLLNVGLTAIAQKLDPVSHSGFETCRNALGAAYSMPCNLPTQKRR